MKMLDNILDSGSAYRFESVGGGTRNSVVTLLLTASCVSVLVGILIVGLWPFHAPKNDVRWSSSGDGLQFGKRGSILSLNDFTSDLLHADSPCSLEILLEPGRVDSGGTILAFYWPASRVVPFILRQFVSGLELQRRRQDLSVRSRVYVDGVFSRPKRVHLAISSGELGTAIYVDGILIARSATFRFSRKDLTGQMIVGNGPSTRNNWSGQIKRLTIYDREILAPEVERHFAEWAKNGPPNLDGSEGVVANYLFDEGGGDIVHNHVESATDLFIPKRFFVIHQQFLERPSSEFHSRWSYWEDVGINIVGFIPFGFLFRGYFTVVRKMRRGNWLTIAMGFAVSLTIEVTQAFLPSRDSGMTDLLTNTFGTALGAILCAWAMKQNWFAHEGISSILSTKAEDTCVTFLSG
jgi:VanZ family protein